MAINPSFLRCKSRNKLSVSLLLALFLSGCAVPPPPNRSPIDDPSNPDAPEAASRPYRPNLIATTRIYLDPSTGAGAQEMKMQMGGMNHAKGHGSHSQPPSSQPMDHSEMHGTGQHRDKAAPADGEQTLGEEMKKASDEMKQLSDAMKATSDAAAQDKGDNGSSASYYTCPMHPEVSQKTPGKCPKCGMALEKKEGKNP